MCMLVENRWLVECIRIVYYAYYAFAHSTFMKQQDHMMHILHKWYGCICAYSSYRFHVTCVWSVWLITNQISSFICGMVFLPPKTDRQIREKRPNHHTLLAWVITRFKTENYDFHLGKHNIIAQMKNERHESKMQI